MGFLLKEDGDKLLQETGDKIIVDMKPVRLAASANISAGGTTATTARLTAPSGKTAGADFQAGTISDDTNPLPAIDLASGSKYTEVAFAIKLTDGAVLGTTYKLRLTKNGTVIDTYTVTPKITYTAGGAILYLPLPLGYLLVR